MNDPIASIARYLSADVRELGTLSQNVANLTTPGYRSVHSLPAFAQGLQTATRVDTRDGALVHTGRSLDMALQGSGFFQVQSGDRVMLTRSGQFHRDASGLLVDDADHPVLGVDGPISLDSDTVSVAADGTLSVGKDAVAQLALVDVADPTGLQPMGNGLYATAGATGASTANVHQGSLEGSNVDPGHEIVRLMELSRHAGAIQHAISTYHSAVIAGIDQIGKDN